jgi:hypothetical protein
VVVQEVGAMKEVEEVTEVVVMAVVKEVEEVKEVVVMAVVETELVD